MSLPPVILEYLVWTSPAPLRVSTAAVAASGRIDVSVTSGGTGKYCSQIQVAVPIGRDATDFSEATPTAAVNTAKWTLSSRVIVSGTDLGLDDASAYVTFTLDARDPSVYKIDYDLVLSLNAAVNDQVGVFGFIVRETSGTDASTLTEKQSVFYLQKVGSEFYLENFVATTTTSPLVPATEFDNGAAIRLSWESNGTWFMVYEKNNAAPIYSGSAKSFTVSRGAASDTTYFLQASMTGDPDGDPAGFEPIYLFDSVTITITNPVLTPTSVAVAEGLTVTGATTLAGLTVSGNESVPVITTGAGYNTVGIHALQPHPWPSLHVVAKPIQSEILPGEIARFEGRDGAFLSITQDPLHPDSMSIDSLILAEPDVDYAPYGLFLNPSGGPIYLGGPLRPKPGASFKTNHGDDTDGLALIRSLRPQDHLMVDQSPIQYALVNAVKELAVQLEKAQARIDVLEVAGRIRETSAPRAGWLFRLYEWCAARFRS